jgi:hypothetical protein
VSEDVGWKHRNTKHSVMAIRKGFEGRGGRAQLKSDKEWTHLGELATGDPMDLSFSVTMGFPAWHST